MNTLAMLAAVFAKVALGAFGGGLATIPFIHHELVAARPWLTETMFAQTISLAQMTPGPVALNSATFTGYRLAGFWGSLWASAALVGTPILVISLLLWLISRASERILGCIESFQRALRPAVSGMLLVAFWALARPLIPKDLSSLRSVLPGLLLVGLVAACFALSRLRIFRAYPQLLILASALAGLCLKGLLS